MQDAAAPQARRLLRILFIWVGQLPADPGSAKMLLAADLHKTPAAKRKMRCAVYSDTKHGFH
jgi:hypothetical protein